jgi:hypothetical protein
MGQYKCYYINRKEINNPLFYFGGALMSIVKEYEEKFISAYCRLEYETWYQGYKDDVSKYLKGNSVCDALEEFIESNTKDIIKVSGEPCKTTEELYGFIQSILFFLENNDDYTVTLALPYEKQQLADTMAYKITTKEINEHIVVGEMKKDGYIIQISRICCFKSIFFINLYPNRRIKYRKSIDKNYNLMKGEFKIDAGLYNEICKWAENYVAENKIDGWLMGEEIGPHDYKFKVTFSDDFYGIDLRYEYLPDYESNKIEGNGPLTKLLQLPELKALFEELKE